MAATVHCDIVSAEEEIFSGAVEMVTAHGDLGDLGIAPGHTPLLTKLAPGPIQVTMAGGEQEIFYLSGGMLEVQPSVVTVLADTAIRAGNLDEAQAEEAKKRAQQQLENQSGEIDYSAAAAHLAEAAAQLRTIQQIKARAKR